MFCYIVLHYQVLDETENCIKQLRKISGKHKIIIVDNCSPNGSGIKLKKIFNNDPEIDVILNDTNYGFAKGNNIGCEYAKRFYNPDFYVVMNNDIELIQENFQEKVEVIYSQEDFDILGPDIYSTTQKIHQSPKSVKRTTIEETKKLRESYFKKTKSRFIVPIRCYLKKISFLRWIHNSLRQEYTGIDYKNKLYNVPLHGSCVIFSKQYMNKRSEAFFPKTFFYYEMEILDYECQLFDYKVVYDPTLVALHHQNISTNATYNNELKRVRFMNEQNYKSINTFIDEYGN